MLYLFLRNLSRKFIALLLIRRMNTVLLLQPVLVPSFMWQSLSLSSRVVYLPPLGKISISFETCTTMLLLFSSYSSSCPIIWLVPSAIFPLSSLSHLYFSALVVFVFQELHIVSFFPQRAFRRQPLIFLILVCYMKVSKKLWDSQWAPWYMTGAGAANGRIKHKNLKGNKKLM